MAVLEKLPGLAIINGLKGVIDFYVWKGIPCARAWPRSPSMPRSPGVKATWPAFAWASSNWNSLSSVVQDAYNWMAQGTNMTGRDLFTKSFINGDSLYLEDA